MWPVCGTNNTDLPPDLASLQTLCSFHLVCQYYVHFIVLLEQRAASSMNSHGGSLQHAGLDACVVHVPSVLPRFRAREHGGVALTPPA